VLLRPGLTEEVAETRLVAILLQLWHRPQLAGQLLRIPLLDVASLRLLTRAFLRQPVQLTAQLLPIIRPGYSRHLHGPGDQLAGLTYAEWIAAENWYFRYRQSKDPAHLQQLIATLYRPRTWQRQPNGDRRQAYNPHTVERRAREVAQLPAATQQAILFYYDSCRSSIISRYAELFPGKQYDDDPDPAPVNPTRNYLQLLRELAGSPDRFQIIGDQDVHNVFFDLNERIAQANREADALANKQRG
jgi:hypothetical protein